MTVQVLLERALDANGNALSGALAYSYLENTTTDETLYADVLLTTPHAQPIVADSEGRFPQAFHGGSVRLKIVYQTAGAVEIETQNPAQTVAYDSSSASSIGFTPTGAVPKSNVQEAIEHVSAQITNTTDNAQTIVGTAGSSNAYTLTAASAISAYAAGQEFLIRINHENTGAATLNIDGLGAKALQKYDASGSVVAMASGDLLVGAMYRVHYDGTRFVVSDTILRDDDTLSGGNRASASSESIKTYVQSRDVLATEIATISGTSHSFALTGTVRRVVVMLDGVSLNGATDRLAIRLGTGGAATTTGYLSGASEIGGATNDQTTFAALTRGAAVAANAWSGRIVFEHMGGNSWVWNGTLYASGQALQVTTGVVTLAGALDYVALISSTATDSFDAGAVNISYEVQ